MQNPIINPPYGVPARHWQLNERGRWTEEEREGRRPSAVWTSVPDPVRKHAARIKNELPIMTLEEIEPHKRINRIRRAVKKWRDAGWPEISRNTRKLLEHWSGESVHERPFFAQMEAVETVIWLNEAGRRYARREHREIRDKLKEVNKKWGGRLSRPLEEGKDEKEEGEGLPRQCIKMATGTGKTKVMAMVALWLGVRNPGKAVDILVMTPNLTVKDRLSVLRPGDKETEYRKLLPPGMPMPNLRVTIMNFQRFQKHTLFSIDGTEASSVEKALLARYGTNDLDEHEETVQAMLERILKTRLGSGGRSFWVFNDEAHHCYGDYATDDKVDSETKEDARQARLWFGALKALQREGALHQVLDFSATPMFMQRPKRYEGVIFPWTVSDYPLIEAAEAGLVKIPVVPVRDSSEMDEPKYRRTYEHTTPKSNFGPETIPELPKALLSSMCEDWEKKRTGYQDKGHEAPPALIVVCPNIKTATAFYGYLGGHKDGENWRPGAHKAFSNIEADGQFGSEIRTLLVHSRMDDKIDQVAKHQREIFKHHLGGEKDLAEAVRDTFLTVGKAGEAGQNIRCVVSVSMLTEGWDARTVCQIFGFRRFGSQLLCEQVTGRALRRTTMGTPNKKGLLAPEYAEVFGVPFEFMNIRGRGPLPTPVAPYEVKTVAKRKDRRITFPHVTRLLYQPPEGGAKLAPKKADRFVLNRKDPPPGTTVIEPPIGPPTIVSVGPGKRRQSILWEIARGATRHFDESHRGQRPVALARRRLFADMLDAVRQWLALPQVEVSGEGVDMDILGWSVNLGAAARAVADACVQVDHGEAIRAVFADQDPGGQPSSSDTGDRRFQTILKHSYPESKDGRTKKSELNLAACHSASEVRLAEVLDNHPRIHAWARNFRMGWNLPWFDESIGDWREYEPDFVARGEEAGTGRELNLVFEFKGVTDKQAEEKAKFADLWCEAVGREQGETWQYVFIDDVNAVGAEVDRALKGDALSANGERGEA